MPWLSVAEWPKGTIPYLNDKTTDGHDTKEQAEGVCKQLKLKGWGGEGKVFPLKTYTEPND